MRTLRPLVLLPALAMLAQGCSSRAQRPAGPPAPAASVSSPGSETRPRPDAVVVLHGLGRTRASMHRVAATLRRDGYRVVNVSYPSRTMPLEQLADEWLPALLREHGAEDAPRLHFVTHSMGGIIVRLWLRDNPAPANLGRIVMIAPPNHGSEVADRLRGNPLFRLFTGVNGARLGTGADSLPAQLGAGPAAARIGVIAGNRSLNPVFSCWIHGPDDGKVGVASARLDGMGGFIELPYSHTWLSWRRPVLAQVGAFLRDGEFGRL
jgi:triacylglycerol esterase/lipase EstA (alpha/beta hydrolase family)